MPRAFSPLLSLPVAYLEGHSSPGWACKPLSRSAGTAAVPQAGSMRVRLCHGDDPSLAIKTAT